METKDLSENDAFTQRDIDSAAQGDDPQPLYKIGEIEEISGLNAQSIRRYDAKGILLGQRDDANNYRYYDPIELCMAIYIRYLRNFGFSLGEVDRFINTEIPLQTDMTKNLYGDLTRQKQLLEGKIECLEELHGILERTAAQPDACTLEERPAMLGIFYRDQNDLLRNAQHRERTANWVNHTPIVRPMFKLSHAFLFAEGHPKTEYKIGLCVPLQYASMVGLEENAHCFSIPPCRCIHTVFEGYDAIASRPDYVDAIQERVARFAAENGLVTKGPIYGSSFHSRRTPQGLHHFARMWIPIEE